MPPSIKKPAGCLEVSEILRGGDAGPARLFSEARRLLALDEALSRLLAPEVAARVRSAALREGRLVVATSSATLAARLRLDADRLVEELHAMGEKAVNRLEVRVAPLPAFETPHNAPRALSPTARRALQDMRGNRGPREEVADKGGKSGDPRHRPPRGSGKTP